MKASVNPLSPGDVIRTHPGKGYWGCAVVLSARDGTTRSYPTCHIGMTTLIRHRKYAWKDVDPSGLQLVKRAVEVRVGPNDYVRDPRVRTAIGIYAVKSGNHVDVVGRVDPTRLYSQPLTFDVGDGTAGAYPLCGSLSANLGWEAVVAWRRLHDAEQLHKDTLKNRRQFEKFEQERLANARLSRARRRTNRRADETA